MKPHPLLTHFSNGHRNSPQFLDIPCKKASNGYHPLWCAVLHFRKFVGHLSRVEKINILRNITNKYDGVSIN